MPTGKLVFISSVGVVVLVLAVGLGSAFVPATLGPPTFFVGQKVSAAVLQGQLAQARSYQSQLVAATNGSVASAEATGRTLQAQISAWQAGLGAEVSWMTKVANDLSLEAADMISSGSIAADTLAKTNNDITAAAGFTDAVSARYDITALVHLAKTAGFRGNGIVVAAAVAMAESQGNPLSIDYDSNGTTDYGLWQINWPTHAGVLGIVDPTTLYDPATNAEAAYVISDHGTNWRPWVTYQTGAEIPYLLAAKAAVSVG
jgi:hypothetical protein